MRALPRDLLRKLESGGRDLTILVIRLGAFGDILRTLPAVRLLRAAVPDARIDWLADDRWAGFLEAHSDLDRIVAFPRASRGSVLRCVATIRSGRPDLVLDFHGNLRSGVLGRLSGARVRLGYQGHQQKEGNRFFSTHRVPAGARRRSRMQRNLDLIRALGVADSPLPDGGIRFTDEDRAEVSATISAAFAGGSYAVLSPGASRGQAYKKPPAALLAAAARALAASGIGTLVVFGPGETADAEAVIRETGAAARLAPPTTLRQLAALLHEARAFVGGDSGPLHLACAVGCPVLALYGPTDPLVNEPWGVPFVALAPPGRSYTGIKKRDREAGGFAGLTPSLVEEGVRQILRASRSVDLSE